MAQRARSKPLIPEDLGDDPSATYNPARSISRAHRPLPTTSPTVFAVPGPSGVSPSARTAPVSQTPAEETFQLTERLAQGGFGEIWGAIQGSLGRPIAVKRLRQDRLRQFDAEQRRNLEEAFRQEALVTARLEHPNIVPVYQLGIDATDQPLLGMKLVRGRPWNRLIRKDRDLPLDELLSRHLPILIDVAQAVAFAHSKGVLHRDLKPQQVMVGEFGEVLLTDWGLAAAFGTTGDGPSELHGDPAESAGSVSTASPGPAGTPSFMAPEQTGYEIDQLGPWTDLFLLGGLLYYLLTGSPPHPAKDSAAALTKAASCKITPPIKRRPESAIPRELNDLAVSVLQADPEDRQPDSVLGFISAVEEYLSGASRKRRSRALIAEVIAQPASNDYSLLNASLNQLQTAQALWPQHPEIESLRDGILARFAEAALAQKDLILAKVQAHQLSGSPAKDRLLERIEIAQQHRRAGTRQRRIAFATIVVLLGLLVVGSLKYTYDQRLAGQQLLTQRDAARAARADAEGLMTFMLRGLWDGLLTIERVDLLEPVARRADAYYSGRDAATMSLAERTNRGVAFETISQTLTFQGDIEGALVAGQKAADIFQRLLAEEPASRERLLRYLEALIALASNQSDLGSKDEALTTYHQVLQRCEQALVQWPADTTITVTWLTALDGSGIVLYDRGELEPAHNAFTKATELARALGELDPEFDLREYLAGPLFRRAVTFLDSGRPSQALASIEEAVELLSDLLLESPASDALLSMLGFAESIHATILGALGRHLEGARLLRLRRPELGRLVAQDPANAERKYQLSLLELVLGELEQALGDDAAAETVWRSVVETLEPLKGETDNAYLLDSLVRAYIHLGQIEDARPIATHLLAIDWTHQNFVQLCSEHGITPGTP